MSKSTTNVQSPRILVFAYQEVGYACLEEILRQKANVIAVISHEDEPGENLWFRSVSGLARQHHIPVYTPTSVNSPDWITRIRELQPELILSFYYRNLLPDNILSIPRLGAYNMHGSLLPKYRGRAPLNWALVFGESQTGVTLHRMVARPDAGDIVDQEAVTIGRFDTIRDLYLKITEAARRVIARQLSNLQAGRAPGKPQDESLATYVGKRTPEHGRIDWARSARTIFNLIRAVTHPFPGAFTEVEGRRLYIWWAVPHEGEKGYPGEVVSVTPLRVATGCDSLEILAFQWETENEQESSEGNSGLFVGQTLGSQEP